MVKKITVDLTPENEQFFEDHPEIVKSVFANQSISIRVATNVKCKCGNKFTTPVFLCKTCVGVLKDV